jgi:hypothetical protein
MTYAGTPYGGAPFGGGAVALRPVAEHLAAADPDELRRVALEAAEIVLERNEPRALTLLADMGYPLPKTRVDKTLDVLTVIGFIIAALQFIQAGTADWTAEQVMELFDRAFR